MMENNSISYNAAVAAFHIAIDNEQSNNITEAYMKYAEGLSLIGITMKEESKLLENTHIRSKHNRLLQFAAQSIDRLSVLLKKMDNNNVDYAGESGYNQLSKILPEIVTNRPIVSQYHDASEELSPLTYIVEENERILKRYRNRLESISNPLQRQNLHLELERRLAENQAILEKKQKEWERKKQLIWEQCRQLAEEKFDISSKIKSGTVNDDDLTKLNLYAACLQFNREHAWSEELSCKIETEHEDVNLMKKIISHFLKDTAHPLSCTLRQDQQKILHKLTNLLHSSRSNVSTKNEEVVREENLKVILKDIKEDLFLLCTVMQALWSPMSTDANQTLIYDLLFQLYFAPVKPYLIGLLRITLNRQESELQNRMMEYTNSFEKETAEKRYYHRLRYGSIINKLYQLQSMYSPSDMMLILVEILRELSGNTDDGVKSLCTGIDDLMPKLTDVILSTNMPSIIAEVTFMENFMPSKRALGEEGYAVTVFQSVISCIITEAR